MSYVERLHIHLTCIWILPRIHSVNMNPLNFSLVLMKNLHRSPELSITMTFWVHLPLKKKKRLEAIWYIKYDSGSFILGSGAWREGGLFPGEDIVLLINKGKKNSDAHLPFGNSPPKWKTLWTLKIY